MRNFEHDKKATLAAVSMHATANAAVPSKALQEIIDILRYPFQTSCDHCNGLGFVRNGQDCPSCEGTGKVIDDFFK